MDNVPILINYSITPKETEEDATIDRSFGTIHRDFTISQASKVKEKVFLINPLQYTKVGVKLADEKTCSTKNEKELHRAGGSWKKLSSPFINQTLEHKWRR